MPDNTIVEPELRGEGLGENKESLEGLQVVKFARDFSKIYKSEKQKRICVEKLNAELEERNKELMDFAFLASSNLEEPLKKMDHWIARLKKEIKNTDAGECIEGVQNSADRLHHLITETNHFFRINSAFVRFKPTSLESVLVENLSDLQLLLQSSGARVEIGELPMLETDPVQLRILFQNLLTHIFRFNCAEENCPVKISARPESDDSWRIIFTGNGPGFELQKLKIILNSPVSDDDRFEIEKVEMALSFCRKIARRLGGSLNEENSDDEKFTFNLVLPKKAGRHMFESVVD